MSSSTGLFRSTHSFAVVTGRLGFESLADGNLVDPRLTADLCHLHERSAPDVEFRLTSTGSESVLSGWVDLSNIDDFTRLVEVLAEAGTGNSAEADPLTFRLDDCSFIDHRALLAVDAAAASTGQRARLRGGPAYVGRLVAMLGLRQVEVIG